MKRSALTDLAPELHCHIVRFLDARSAVGYVGASRALRVFNHAQALALRPAVGIGECLCGCDMHLCDRCSCGTRYDNIHLTMRMGCSTLCYPAHVSALLAANRTDDARLFCRRLMDLVLAAFAHLGGERSREAFASWILYDALLCTDDLGVREAAAILAHEIAGTCVFHQDVWESSSVLGAENAILRGHYECLDCCIDSACCPSHARRGFLDSITPYSIAERVMRNDADDGTQRAQLESLKAWCDGVARYRPDLFQQVAKVNHNVAYLAAAGGYMSDDAHAVLAQFMPDVLHARNERNSDSDATRASRLWQWSRAQSKRLSDALAAERLGDFDALCAEVRQKVGSGKDPSSVKGIINILDNLCDSRVHKSIVYANETVAVFVVDALVKHFPHAWADGLGAAMLGSCWKSECVPCTAVMPIGCARRAVGTIKLKGRHLCFALWPPSHKRGRRVRESRARALALLACDSVRWPRRAALTAAAYGDMEVLEALVPQHASTDPWGHTDTQTDALVDTKPPLWATGVVALLAAAGYDDAAQRMASRYRIDHATLDVDAIVRALDATRPRKPWSSLYSAVVPKCPLPLSVLLTLRRHYARNTIAKAVAQGAGAPMHPVDCVRLASTFPGVFDGLVASQTVLPTTAVGAIDWLCRQTALRFDTAYTISCASIGATGTVHYLVVRHGVACDVDAVRAALPQWVGEPYQDNSDDDVDDDHQQGGDRRPLHKPIPWIDFMEPVLGKVPVADDPLAGSSGS
ncbi:Dioxygenase domain-containing protein [Pandoravirus kuranda]|uniref:Dioxygenase domain-containing protein n=1 Tax=Pandoravirus kuranda TaxID=3019033 RepID=A0AA95EDP1_9VIRU|nr:Dioxygenase domain-containing protein [Pandoravirus kuranda]